jgi:hypothetical protein
MKATSFAMVLGALVLGGGCGSPSGVDRAETAAESMAEVRELAAKATKQIDAQLKALNAVSAAKMGDPKPAYKTYTEELANSQALAAKIKATADEMRAKGRAFFSEWEKQLDSIQDADLKAKSRARASERSKQYAELEESMGTARGRWEIFNKDLTDLKTYLDNDLNAKGIESASAVFTKANLDGVDLKNRVAQMTTLLNKVASELAPGK